MIDEALLILAFVAGIALGVACCIVIASLARKPPECPCQREKREAERADSWWRDGSEEPEYEP